MSPHDLLEVLSRDVIEGSRCLLGWDIVREGMRARIVETEAYRHDDPACHAYGKVKMKNMALYAEPGRAYIYLAYGNHWMLNVVAHPEGDAAAVLVRAAKPLTGQAEMFSRRPKAAREEDLLSGPGKLATAFGITGADNMAELFSADSELRLEHGGEVSEVLVGPRIGIAFGKAHDYPWRFIDGHSLRWASKPWPRP